MEKSLDTWRARFFDLALSVSEWSKDPGTKVGCVAVKNRRVVSTGFNGFPEGVKDTELRLNDKELKYKLVVHSEQNAIYNAAKEGVSLKGATLYVHGLPCCHECAKGIIQAGIKEVHMRFGVMLPKWRDSFEYTKLMFDEAGVKWECVEVGS